MPDDASQPSPIPADYKGIAAPRTADGIAAAAAFANVETIAIQAVIAVETRGDGFLDDGRPKILFERHHFSAITKRRFDASDPDISSRTPGGYVGGAGEYDRLARAQALVAGLPVFADAGLRAASWGLPQIMGDNYAAAGFDNVQDFVAAMCAGEDQQLLAMAHFLVAAGCDVDLRLGDFPDFARRYNGPNYAANGYDRKLAAEFAALRHAGWTGSAPSEFDARKLVSRIQAALNVAGYGPLEVDGWMGPKTAGALTRYQAAEGLEQTGEADPATLAALLPAD